MSSIFGINITAFYRYVSVRVSHFLPGEQFAGRKLNMNPSAACYGWGKPLTAEKCRRKVTVQKYR